MANEFIIKNGYFSQGSSNITGSLSVSQGITGSLFGTASFATTASYILNSVSSSFASTASYISPTFISASAAALGFGGATVSASYAATASYYQELDPIFVAVSASFATTASLNSFTSSYISASSSFSTRITNNEASIISLNTVTNSFATTGSNTFYGTQTINGNVNIFGTASISYLNVSYESASVIYSSGSNQFGDSTADTQTLIGSVIVSGSLQTTGSINITGSLTVGELLYPSVDNGEESFIQTDGNGTLSLQYVKTIYEEIYNGEATQLVKGTPVYVSGSVGAASVVYRADASDPTKMPVIYIAADTLDPAGTGRGIALGLIKGVNTTGYPEGTEIFVGIGGGWTSTRPTGSAVIQSLGIVTKEGVGGQGVVLNPGPVNLPNINSGSVWVGNADSIPIAVATSSLSVLSSSYSVTASYALNGGVTQIVAGNNISINPSDGYGVVTITSLPPNPNTGSLLITASIIDNVITFTKGDAATFNITIESSSYAVQAATASYVVSASYATQATSASYAESSSYATNTSYLNGKDSAVFITTGSDDSSQIIYGSITINQNLTVLGSSSIQYITSSQLVIADNIVSVNTFNPSLRFGGLAVIDSGSSPQTSGSLLFDSQNNQWIFVHQSDSTSAVTSSVLIMGPQTFNDVGNETTITANRLTKGTGGDLGEHIGDSNITDTGTVVSINSNTYVTGSLDVTQGITGSLFGTASWALNSVTASYAIAALSSSYALTASYTPFNYGLVYAIATQNFLT